MSLLTSFKFYLSVKNGSGSFHYILSWFGMLSSLCDYIYLVTLERSFLFFLTLNGKILCNKALILKSTKINEHILSFCTQFPKAAVFQQL